MQKPQVTIAVQARGLRGPLGQPVVQAFIASEGDEQQLVVLQYWHGEMMETIRMGWPQGRLKAARADLLSNLIGDVIYNCLLKYVGIEGDLEDLT